MKKVFFTLLITIVSALGLRAQIKSDLDWRKEHPKQSKDLIKNMSPDEKKELLKRFRENMLVEDLKIPEKNQERFKKVYNEYQEAQRKIKEQFNHDFDPEKLSDDEAKQKLEESFTLGQKLLENRRDCARKMQNVVRPQQVLKMFQTEGKIRKRMMDRRMEHSDVNTARKYGDFK